MAAWPGTVGFRPTRGCYNAAGGIVPMTTTRDTAGVIARSVPDIIMFGGSHASGHAHSGHNLNAANMHVSGDPQKGLHKEKEQRGLARHRLCMPAV